MSGFRIRADIAVISDRDSGWFLLEETGRRRIAPGLAAELIGLISTDCGDEDHLVEALENRFPLEEIYYTLIELEKFGIIVRSSGLPESPVDLFRTKIQKRKTTGHPLRSFSPLSVRIIAIGETGSHAHLLATSLSRSDILKVECVSDWHESEALVGAVSVVVTPDLLEPELEVFGKIAYEQKLRWLPAKLSGVIPSIGPLFIPGQTGCSACLLDRVKGHRRLEVEQINRNGGNGSLRLSAGRIVHSLETVMGLLAIELEKIATDDVPDILGKVLTLDFRSITLEKHSLVKRPQCPQCGGLHEQDPALTLLQKEPLSLQTRLKADHRDGGERVCSAVETLANYAHLISPVTGLTTRLTSLKDIPSCFGHVIRSDWIIRRGEGGIVRAHQNPRFSATGLSTGKGRNELQARASALGETIERYCTQYEGYEPCITASFTELGDQAIHPYDLMGFSERQYETREMWRQKGGTAHVPDPYDVTRPIDWTPAWSLTQRRWRLIPSAFVYYSYPPERGGDICQGCSNGVAAGNCLEEAILQGFFELVERDATAMWWYHKLPKAAIDWRTFDSPFVAAVSKSVEAMGMQLQVLDLTNDLEIPVFAANLFIRREDHRFKSIGLGCHRDPYIALERAISELGQSWKQPDMDEYSLLFQKTRLSREPFLKADANKPPKTSSDFAKEQRTDFLDDINDMVRLLQSRGLELLVVDLTRPDVGFPVTRVIVPGLIHFWPRFGCRRLFEVPLAAGWISSNAGENDLNPVPFCW